MGKVIGGGLPAAAYGGPRELMERIAPAGDVYQAGHAERATRSPSPPGWRRCGMLDEPAYLRLAATTEALADRPARGRAAASVPVTIATAPGLLTVFFSRRPGRRLRRARRRATSTPSRAWCRALLARGVYAPPSQFEAWFPSLAHGPEHVERTVEAAAAAFAALRA